MIRKTKRSSPFAPFAAFVGTIAFFMVVLMVSGCIHDGDVTPMLGEDVSANVNARLPSAGYDVEVIEDYDNGITCYVKSSSRGVAMSCVERTINLED